ncbi:hypothetical protein PIB30_028169 [Stylosanthes scabra]|uniref:Replication factor A C-terminal domain-containing protein n=1 Tax=Stylosanthes scabra TaxID=79078 RepID=A0ABU6ZAR3_9FABA|nr:hypothetical protein [Stylosanthes scabra]
MSNFIVRVHRSGLKVTSHKYKLGVFLKTNVSILSDDVFPFCPFRFTPFREIDEMCTSNNIFLIVVGKEAPEDIITKAGQSSKRLRLYLEDAEKNKMKCTLFGDFVGEALSHLERTDVQPLVSVGQLFKPHVWLEDVNVQTSFYGSRVFFNPTFPDAIEFRNSHVESQGQRSLTQELSSAEFRVLSIEEVYNLTEETECWILSTVVSVEGGKNDWFYASCKGCFKKVIPVDDNYHCTNVKCGQRGSNPPLKFRLKVIVADGTGCLAVLLWNTECASILGMSPNDVRDISKNEKGNGYPKIFNQIVENKYLVSPPHQLPVAITFDPELRLTHDLRLREALVVLFTIITHVIISRANEHGSRS